MLDGQFEERPLDLLAIGDPGDVVDIIGSIDQVDRDLEPPPGSPRSSSTGPAGT